MLKHNLLGLLGLTRGLLPTAPREPDPIVFFAKNRYDENRGLQIRDHALVCPVSFPPRRALPCDRSSSSAVHR
jgi:hypothetical protein